MTPTTHPTNDARLAEMAKRHVDAILRDRNSTYDQLRLAWQALHETVKARTS